MKNMLQWTAVLITAVLLVVFVVGLVSGMFLSAAFWVIYIAAAMVDWFIISRIKRL